MEVGREFQAPRTVVEKTLCEIWEEILGLNRVGVKDNFFEVCGDSILCVQIVARAREAGLQLTVQQMFQYQTVAELAVQIQPVVAESCSSPALLTGEVPLTPIQSWFFEQNLTEASYYNQAFLLDVSVPLKQEVLARAMRLVESQHDALRLRFTNKDGAWRQRYAAAGLSRCRRNFASRASHLANAEASRPQSERLALPVRPSSPGFIQSAAESLAILGTPDFREQVATELPNKSGWS